MKRLKDDRKYWETYDGGIAFYKYGVKAIWFMFAVLKDLNGFLPAVRKNNPRNLLNTQEKATIKGIF